MLLYVYSKEHVSFIFKILNLWRIAVDDMISDTSDPLQPWYFSISPLVAEINSSFIAFKLNCCQDTIVFLVDSVL